MFSLSEGISRDSLRKMIHIAVLTATIVGLAFLFFGQLIRNVMGISAYKLGRYWGSMFNRSRVHIGEPAIYYPERHKTA